MKELNMVKSMAGTGTTYLEVIQGIQFRVKGDTVHFQINRYNKRNQYITVDVPINKLIGVFDDIRKGSIEVDYK